MDNILYLFVFGAFTLTESVLPPSEIHVVVRGYTAIINWTQDGDISGITRFELTCEILGNTIGTVKITHGINKTHRAYKLWGLLPSHRYKIYMVTITDLGASNTSEAVVFTTNLTDTFEYIQVRSRGIQIEEAIVVFVVVGLWACAMVLFIKQWDNIRILQPQEPRFKHNPKNLDTITIVKKPQDSVIYKNYSRKMSLTMVEREKRLMRMNTVPIMENVASLQTLTTVNKLPTIEMTEETSIKEEVELNDVNEASSIV
ncbi:Fibronectin type III domain-containing protein 5 [Mactra antiquata]